jgi:dTDP-glucose 4,6-dehydratase
MQLWSDNREARRLLGWGPRVPLDVGLKKTIDWIASHLERYRPGRHEI